MPRLNDIPPFTPSSRYSVDVGWRYLPDYYLQWIVEHELDVSPDFQRGYVWTPEQKVRYIEFCLRGGQTGRDIYVNHPGWGSTLDLSRGPVVLVDGKQRLDAILGFLNNEFRVFGHFFGEYEDKDRLRDVKHGVKWHVNDLQTRDDVLRWYVDLNRGGTVHSDDEIERVRALIGKGGYEPPSEAERLAEAGLQREILVRTSERIAAEKVAREKEFAERTAREAVAPKRRTRRSNPKLTFEFGVRARMSYRDVVKNYRSLAEQSSAYQVKALLLLVSCEDRPATWNDGPYKTFRALVREENLCSWAHYVRFREVSRNLSQEDLESLGTYGAAQLADHTREVQAKAVRFARKWTVENGAIPTHQRIARFLKPFVFAHDARRPKREETKAELRAALKRAHARIRKLEQENRALRGEKEKTRGRTHATRKTHKTRS